MYLYIHKVYSPASVSVYFRVEFRVASLSYLCQINCDKDCHLFFYQQRRQTFQMRQRQATACCTL